MSKTYETGHSKNVANLQKLIEQVTVYTSYNPPIENLKIENLNTLYNNALAIVNETEEKRSTNKIAIHNRKQAFDNLKSLTTKIVNHLDILNLEEGQFEQAKAINRLIQGAAKKAKTPTENPEAETKTVSTSRQSFTQLADNFSKLLQIITSVTGYTPNEDELKLENLNTYHATLVSTTQMVNQTEALLNTKLIERDTILYANNTGLYDTVQNVKKYVKSIYGATAPEYKNISKISFKGR